ncbi:Pentatricopeptide repeat [Dillenia turbinata]|uniref:Pentatricopeptide repeat n=1 Tax=Dillenia turbinata TaxID=194707 RepID=A0AAN8W1E7_9MAGN
MLSHHLQDVCRVTLPAAASAAATHCRIIKTGCASHNTASLVSAYVHSGCLPLAHQLLLESLPFCSFNLLTGNLIIARYGHFHFNFARSVFDKMPVRDVVSWNSMIGACVKNEHFHDAIRFFKQMLSSPGIQPDEFTFASLLSGCARLGSFTRAKWLHDLMISKGIKLNSILSAALIDMYSKCGRIEEASGIFEITNQRSDVSVWNAMINGLAIHGLAFDAIKVFSQMEAENVAPDSITFLGKWNEAERFRDSMRRNRVRKNLGKSWLELAGAIHHFKAGDRSHPETKEIYRVLDGLLTRAKLEGFEPVQEFVMMDVSEEEKEGSLNNKLFLIVMRHGIKFIYVIGWWEVQLSFL